MERVRLTQEDLPHPGGHIVLGEGSLIPKPVPQDVAQKLGVVGMVVGDPQDLQHRFPLHPNPRLPEPPFDELGEPVRGDAVLVLEDLLHEVAFAAQEHVGYVRVELGVAPHPAFHLSSLVPVRELLELVERHHTPLPLLAAHPLRCRKQVVEERGLVAAGIKLELELGPFPLDTQSPLRTMRNHPAGNVPSVKAQSQSTAESRQAARAP
ncbi:MAG: hypothetical protein NUV94_05330 [Candidatus Acetothermia bacterium]|jgi:hypothetical protein|nr:hypothetical protein [Candidatus Acetothermia bacterium]